MDLFKTVQYFSDDYLDQCKSIKPEQIVKFLEEFRALHLRTKHVAQTPHQPLLKEKPTKSKLISIKIPEDLLKEFKSKAQLAGTPYQTQIKKLMRSWLELHRK